MNTTTIIAARVIAKLQDEIQAGRKLHTLVVMDGHTFKVDLAPIVSALQPADAAHVVTDDTDKAMQAMIAHGLHAADLGLCVLCNKRDACPRGNGEADLCDACYAAWERAGFPSAFTLEGATIIQAADEPLE